MSNTPPNHQRRVPYRVGILGGTLVVLALIAVVVSYPPPTTGFQPLFGAGNMFLPLIVSVLALLIAIGGGILLTRVITNQETDRFLRIAIRVLVPIGLVAAISAYLVVVAGFDTQAPFVIGAVLLALVIGFVDIRIN